MEKTKFRMPTAYTILFLLIILVAICTWIIPAGAYDYVDGVPVAGTYHETASSTGATTRRPWRTWRSSPAFPCGTA